MIPNMLISQIKEMFNNYLPNTNTFFLMIYGLKETKIYEIYWIKKRLFLIEHKIVNSTYIEWNKNLKTDFYGMNFTATALDSVWLGLNNI